MRGKLSILQRDRLEVKWHGKRAHVLNEVLLHRAAQIKSIPEFEFHLGADEFSFPTCIVHLRLILKDSSYNFVLVGGWVDCCYSFRFKCTFFICWWPFNASWFTPNRSFEHDFCQDYGF